MSTFESWLNILYWPLLIINLLFFFFLNLKYQKHKLVQPDNVWQVFRDLPHAGKFFFVVWLVAALLPLIMTQAKGGVIDSEGFYLESYMIYAAENSDFPIYSEPSIDSEIFRNSQQFESFSLGESENGFVRIRMDKDDLIGWVKIEDANPSKSPLVFQKIRDSFTKAWVLFWSNFKTPFILLDIGFGLLVTWILKKLFGNIRGQVIDDRLTIIIMIITCSSIFILNKAIIPNPILQARHSSFIASRIIISMFPTFLGSGIGDIVFLPRKNEGIFAIIGGFFFCFTFWYVHCKIANLF